MMPDQKLYSITVDYTRTLQQMIDAGKYDSFGGKKYITEDNFPIQRPTKGNEDINAVNNKIIEITLVHMNKVVSTKDVLTAMEANCLRPARIEELLAFGENFPNVQREYNIIGLGSYWIPVGGRHTPCLRGNDRERRLYLLWPDSSWAKTCHFAALRK